MVRLGVLLAAAAVLAAGGARAEPVRAMIDTGALLGDANDRANVFRNIPFAAPPVGDLRWAPPRAVTPWAGERDATKAGPSCPQPMNANGTPNSGGANGPADEDCLQLNVFAPKAAKKAPVMVWIHGGGHRTGAGWVYDGSNFARDGVVVVSINYRLGPLGYFAHPAISKAAGRGATGNFGLMDQIAALQWVQRNAAAFGGDPKNVTVFGESAGGMSILALMATPSARGLYAKAIVQSGLGWVRPVTLAAKEKEVADAISKLGADPAAGIEDLRRIPVDLLVPINADYQPFIDGRLMTETASQAVAAGRFDDVPLIIGSNSREDSLMGPGPIPAARLGPISASMRTAYAGVGNDEAIVRAAFNDRVMGGPARWIAANAARGKPAWLYYFSYVATRMRPAIKGAAHADEIPYAWEYWGRRTPMSSVSEEDKAVATLMHGCWVAFAKTGAPKCGKPEWPRYDPRKDHLMEFGSASGVRTNFRKPQLDLAQTETLPTLALAGPETAKKK